VKAYQEKIIVMFVGLFCILLLCEIVLRVYGYSCKAEKEHYRKSQIGRSTDKYVILCLGNCYTAGSGAPVGQGYPDHLQRLFDQEKNRVRVAVINRGINGLNSARLLDSLEKNIAETSPDLIILQTGSPNVKDMRKYAAYLKRENIFCPDPYPFFSYSRAFRLFALLNNGIHNMSNISRITGAVQETHGRRKRQDPDNKMQKTMKQSNLSKLENYYKGFLFKMGELGFMIQDVDNYPQSLTGFANIKKTDIYKWVESDIREIVRVAQARGVRVLINAYPLPLSRDLIDDRHLAAAAENIKAVNSILRTVADTARLPFVENEDLFQDSPAGEDGLHPDSKGYEMMAIKIHEKIQLDGFPK
jgi:lysophospholipase L1-like esterase